MVDRVQFRAIQTPANDSESGEDNERRFRASVQDAFARLDDILAIVSASVPTTVAGGVTQTSFLRAPQLFNPDGTAVSGGTDDYTLTGTGGVAFVTLNGQVLDDSEYSLSVNTLTVTPDNGFSATDDEVLVFQNAFTATSEQAPVESYREVTSSETLTTTDAIVNCTSGTFTLGLPTAAGIQGRKLTIKNSGAGTITVDPDGAETIDGNATINLTPNQFGQIVSDGTNWIIVG